MGDLNNVFKIMFLIKFILLKIKNMAQEYKQLLLKDLSTTSYKYFPIEFSSYEDYVKYLIEKGFAIEVPEENNIIKKNKL